MNSWLVLLTVQQLLLLRGKQLLGIMCYRFSPNEIASGKFTWIHGTKEFPLTVREVILWVNKNPKRVNQSRESETCQTVGITSTTSCVYLGGFLAQGLGKSKPRASLPRQGALAPFASYLIKTKYSVPFNQ